VIFFIEVSQDSHSETVFTPQRKSLRLLEFETYNIQIEFLCGSYCIGFRYCVEIVANQKLILISNFLDVGVEIGWQLKNYLFRGGSQGFFNVDFLISVNSNNCALNIPFVNSSSV